MIIIISHKIRLDPNRKQTTYLAKAAGTARFAYNWALAEWQAQYAAWKDDNSLPKPDQMSLRRQLNSIKREQFPWMLEVTKNAPQMAIIQLGSAFKNFFAGRASYPQFKKKGKSRDSFTLTNDQFSALMVAASAFSNLGLVRMRETLRFSGKILSATISRTADQWFASLTVDTSASLRASLPPAENQGVVGVDLGVSALATLSTGKKWLTGAKPHKALLFPPTTAVLQPVAQSQRQCQPPQGKTEVGKATRQDSPHPPRQFAPTHHGFDPPFPHPRH
jgi:putative transposase